MKYFLLDSGVARVLQLVCRDQIRDHGDIRRRRAIAIECRDARTDERAVSAEGREQPAIEPQVEEAPAPVVDAPDTTTPKQMHEDPTKLDESGGKG